MMRFPSIPSILLLATVIPTSAAGQETASSPAGTVIFAIPADRMRVEGTGYTALKSIGMADSGEIRLRPPFQSSGSAADAVEMHARWVATALRVQPAAMPTVFRHRGGFDVAVRTFVVVGADGRPLWLVVAALKNGPTTAVIEFFSAAPQVGPAIGQLADFLDGCRLAHVQMLAAGNPPLTRPQADAALDLFYFMAGQLEGVHAAPSPIAKDQWAIALANAWTAFPPETRKVIAEMPATWAFTLSAWPQMTPAARQQVTAAYAEVDVVKILRSDFVAARNPVSPAAPAVAHRPDAGAQTTATADASALMATMNQRYQSAASMLTTQYNATMSMMAGIGNMSGTRYTTR